MKLIWCPLCDDVRKIQVATPGDTEDRVACKCGLSWGRYRRDGLNAEYGGQAMPMGFDNPSLTVARRKMLKSNRHPVAFVAFLVEGECPTFREIKGKAGVMRAT